MSHPLFERHRATLERAVQAIGERSYWSAYPESASPKIYGEGAAEAGKAAFDALLGKRFPLTQPAPSGTSAREKSPFGLALGITYPEGRPRRAVRRGRPRAGPVEEGRPRGVGRRVPRDPRAHQPRELRDRQRGDAHDRARRS